MISGRLGSIVNMVGVVDVTSSGVVSKRTCGPFVDVLSSTTSTMVLVSVGVSLDEVSCVVGEISSMLKPTMCSV